MTLARACYNAMSLDFATTDQIAKHSHVITPGLQA